MRTSHVPVLVVGAGPAGSLLTLELARRGVRVRTVDRALRPTSGSNAFLLHARTLELLARIDERLAARFLERGIRCNGYALHAAGGAQRPAVDFAALDSPYPFLLAHRQSETELYVREYTSAHFGVSPDWGTHFVDAREVQDGVVATLASDGVEEQVHCHYLVGCDGAASRVRAAAGLGEPLAPSGAVVDTIDAVLERWPDDDAWVHYCAAGNGLLVVARLPGERWRLQWLRADGASQREQAEVLGDVQRIVAAHFPAVRFGEILLHQRWERQLDVPPAYRRGRLVLAGDAAHGHGVVSGLDLDCALQDAANLGWKLAFVSKGHAPPELLASYEAERRPVAAAVHATAQALQSALTGSGEVPGCLAERCAGLAPDYRDPTVCEGADLRLPGPPVGAWLPDVELERGRRLFGSARQPNFTLLATAATEAGKKSLEEVLAPLGTRFGAVLGVRVVGPSVALDARFGRSEADRLWVVRPDGYLGYRGLATELPALEAWLADRFVG
jgi:2-polyprenyl-6-methoxyphenol hydroxylase-like FAD-dependent oxidoreductase